MNSFDQFIKDSARSYLQNVVYIDDKIYLPSSNDMDSVDDVPPLRDPFASEKDASNEVISVMAGEDELVSSNADDPESKYAHPKQLMESFADMGIVCALYEPAKDAAVDKSSTIFKICQRADIVVLDWDLSGDNGAKVSELIVNLIEQSDEVQPHHVRLCAIYTNQPNLESTAEALFANLLAKCKETKYELDKLQLVSGATRISILGKPDVPGRLEHIRKKFVVNERQLAKRLLDDFSDMHRGLLSGFALHGLASIRKNTKRLLDKFTSDLDGAFLLHRALVKSDREALEELPELLAGELSAILEDDLLSGIDYESVTNQVIDTLPLTRPDDGEDFCEADIRRHLKDGEVPQKKYKTLERYSVMVGSTGHSSSEKLSLLFNNRTQYLPVPPRLKFGTVVKHRINATDDSWDYSICLMPICDSRNRTQPISSMTFPFWRLNLVLKSDNLAAFVVEDSHSTIRLSVGGKIRDKLWLSNVKLDDGWAKSTPEELRFEDIEQINEIYWVAQLKPLHAQRIALHVGSEASRVGLTESEWLRLVLKRSP